MFAPERIRAITIDLDDTLWPTRPTLERAHAALRRWLRPRAPAAAQLLGEREFMVNARARASRLQPTIAHDVGAIMRYIIGQALQAAHADLALVEPAFALYYDWRQKVTLYDDALPALQYLAQRYRLVSLTNGNADPAAIGIAALFETHIAAAAVGAAKPDAAIFAAAADALALPPGQILHLGDDVQMDGLGALQFGMQMAWVNRDDAPWPPTAALQPHLVVTDLLALRQRL